MENNTRKTSRIGVFGGAAATLSLPPGTPFSPPIYKLDFSTLPALLGGFSLGPVAGVIIVLIKDLETGKEGMYKTGYMVRDARIVRIAKGEVELDVNGKQAFLRTSEAKRLAKNEYLETEMISRDGPQIVVNKQAMISEAGSVMQSLKKLKVRAAVENQKVIGMKIEGLTEDNIAALAGLRNKDVVTAINSQAINSYQKALQVVNKLRNQSEVQVCLLRDGKPMQLTYTMR